MNPSLHVRTDILPGYSWCVHALRTFTVRCPGRSWSTGSALLRCLRPGPGPGPGSNERVVDLRQRVEVRGPGARLLRLLRLALRLVGQAEAIVVLGILLIRLQELGHGLVVVLRRQREDAVELVGL